MGAASALPVFAAGLLFASLIAAAASGEAADEETAYIVSVSKARRPAGFAAHADWYASVVAAAKSDGAAGSGLMYVYDNVFHGFAARLTAAQAEAVEAAEGVLGVMADAAAELHTTRTPEFLGLRTGAGLWPDSDFGDEVIIGVMDSGVWPERPSFADASLGPVPARWRGGCETGPAFSPSLCNRKLVGARSFYKGYEAAVGPINETEEYKSPRDSEGHGTHTASTAAGSRVAGASLLGSAPGIARGIATRARIAAYKVCWKGGCFNTDLLAAFDEAVADGVDVISLSIGGGILPYFLDPVAIGSFGAMQHGVLVSCSAGNGGPSPQSVTNVAPWLLTVGASTLDRDFPAFVKLGNGATYRGVSLYAGKELGQRQIPLIYAGAAGLPGMTNVTANLCIAGSLSPALVKGKIVVCDRGISARASKGMVVKQAGGAGMILANAQINGEELIADSHVLPATLVGYNEGLAIKAYVAGTRHPTASIHFSGTVLGVKPAPVMAAFSSRGPNAANPEILKPDVTAPGVNILAAWTARIGPTELSGDDRVVGFNIMSGTSMSCPHVSGLAALLKAAHPDWSPAAIKSALMTTAFHVDNSGSTLLDGATANSSTPLAYGAGHVSSAEALNPGLVYDVAAQDYLDFLCGLNYTDKWLLSFTKGEQNCSARVLTAANLNYPSLSFIFTQNASSAGAPAGAGGRARFVTTLTRTVTNVGAADSRYVSEVVAPGGVVVRVEPETLAFRRLNEKQSYTVTCEASSVGELGPGLAHYEFGSLTWRDGHMHRVNSPLVFGWQTTSPLF